MNGAIDQKGTGMTPRNTHVSDYHVLNYLSIAELLFTAMVFFLLFFFNWEDWFFGMKLDGIAAGAYLFTKGILAVLLLCLFLKFTGKTRPVAFMALLYYGFLFLDSSATIQKNTGVWYLFAFPFALLMLVPIALLAPPH
jgi:hypothetical protein